MANKSHIRFCVYDFGDDPSVVTEAIGLEPTKSFSKGDPFPNQPSSFRQRSAWELQSPLPLLAEAEVQLEALLTILESNIESVRQAKEKFDAGICCAIYYYEGCDQGFHLSEAIVERIAALGLSIDFDLYFLGDDVSNNGET